MEKQVSTARIIQREIVKITASVGFGMAVGSLFYWKSEAFLIKIMLIMGITP